MSRVMSGAVGMLVALLVHAAPALAQSPKPSSPAPNLRQEIRVAVAHVMRSAPARGQAPAPARDSVKNGVVIGAVIGGVYGAVFAALSGGELSTSGKVGVLWTSAAMGAGLGWLIDWMR